MIDSSPSMACGSLSWRRCIDPRTAFSSLWNHRRLIIQFIRREIESRYRGSVLGLFWALVTPLVMLGVYTFVFGAVFRSRWPGQPGADGLLGFAMVLFAGTTVFNIFSETVGRAPTVVTSVPSYVKKVVFPLEILPLSILGAALFQALICFSLMVLIGLVVHGGIPWTIIFVPMILLPVMLLAIGAAWFFASLGVYLRDVGNIIGVLLQILFFATPIFYPVTAVPESMRNILALNPLTQPVEMFRAACLFGVPPDPSALAISIAIGATAAWFGYIWFSLTRQGFADVL
jgi:lipopolysaccharide transport system permease protein